MVDVRPAAWCAAVGIVLAATQVAPAGPIQDNQFQVQEIVGGKTVPGSVRTFKVKSEPHHVEVTQWGPGSHVSLDFSAPHPDRTGGLLITSNAIAQFAKTSDILRITDPGKDPETFTGFGVLGKSHDMDSISWGWRVQKGPGFLTLNLGGLHFTSNSYLDFSFTPAEPPKPPHHDNAALTFAGPSFAPL